MRPIVAGAFRCDDSVAEWRLPPRWGMAWADSTRLEFVEAPLAAMGHGFWAWFEGVA